MIIVCLDLNQGGRNLNNQARSEGRALWALLSQRESRVPRDLIHLKVTGVRQPGDCCLVTYDLAAPYQSAGTLSYGTMKQWNGTLQPPLILA